MMALDYSQLNWGHYLDRTGLSDSFVAEKVGVSRMAINKFRRGEKKPSRATGEKMALLFKEHLQAQAQYHEKQAKQDFMLIVGIDTWLK
jgi:transcriptional regulator with XRE-family HTH domain